MKLAGKRRRDADEKPGGDGEGGEELEELAEVGTERKAHNPETLMVGGGGNELGDEETGDQRYDGAGQ